MTTLQQSLADAEAKKQAAGHTVNPATEANKDAFTGPKTTDNAKALDASKPTPLAEQGVKTDASKASNMSAVKLDDGNPNTSTELLPGQIVTADLQEQAKAAGIDTVDVVIAPTPIVTKLESFSPKAGDYKAIRLTNIVKANGNRIVPNVHGYYTNPDAETRELLDYYVTKGLAEKVGKK